MKYHEIPVLHPLPSSTRKWKYDHRPLVYARRDRQWEEITGTGTAIAGLLRLVSGWSPRNRTFSRGPDSWISLDTFSLSIAHWWAETAPALLNRIALEEPVVARWAWGHEAAAAMARGDLVWPRAVKGAVQHDPSLDGLLSGWYEIARFPRVVRVVCQHWLEERVPPAIAQWQRLGWTELRSLAALVRLCNSRGRGGMVSMSSRAAAQRQGEREALELLYGPESYDHADRLVLIDEMAEFRGDPHGLAFATDWRSAAIEDLNLEAPVYRVDGSRPDFISRNFLRFVTEEVSRDLGIKP